jgi:hypothetical protein
MAGVSPKRDVFLLKGLLTQPLKSQNLSDSVPNLKHQLENKYTHPWPKTLQKNTTPLSHMSFTTSVSLITACVIFCRLRFHVIYTCTFFEDTVCLLTNRKMIKIVTLIDHDF